MKKFLIAAFMAFTVVVYSNAFAEQTYQILVGQPKWYDLFTKNCPEESDVVSRVKVLSPSQVQIACSSITSIVKYRYYRAFPVTIPTFCPQLPNGFDKVVSAVGLDSAQSEAMCSSLALDLNGKYIDVFAHNMRLIRANESCEGVAPELVETFR